MRRKILLLVMILLCVISVTARIDVEADVVDNSIYLDEQAVFDLKIKNYDEVSRVVQVFTADVAWHIELNPFITKLNPGEEKTVKLSLIPSVWAETGAQRVIVVVESPSTNEQINLELPIFVKSFETGNKQYQPSVELKVTFPEEIDPRETVRLDLYLRNRNRLDISELIIDIKSELFEEHRVVALGPLSERREKFLFEIDDMTGPFQGRLEVSIKVENRTVNRERAQYKIISYANFVQTRDTVQELFKTKSEYYIHNEGNVERAESFRIPTSFFQKLFLRAEPSPSRVNYKEGYLEWDIRLKPQQEMKIQVTVNYIPVIYLVLFFVVVSLVYFIYRSPILIKKEAIVTGASQEGISEMKVLLHIRNRSQDIIEQVQITELIPSIATYVKEKRIGTTEPTRIIKHQKKGTILKWDIDALEPFEERIITYRLKSKITIVGGFTLPPSKIKFESRGKERVIRSNKSSISLSL